MLRNISVTLFTRILITLASFFAVVLNARVTGAAGVGTIGLIVLAISMIQLFNNVVGGGALIYLVPRNDVGLLLLPSYLWSIVTALVGTLLLSYLHLIPTGFAWHVVFLSILQAGISVNLSIIVGKEKYYAYNILSIIQYILLLSILLILYFVLKNKSIFSYIYSLYCSYSVVYIFSFLYLKPKLFHFKKTAFIKILKELISFGVFVQFASIFQLLSSRLSYYFIEIFLNRAALGVFTIGTQLSESVWLVGKSVATVQYSRISNSQDANYAVRITTLFVKFSFVVTNILLLIMLSLPDAVFTWVFSGDFVGVRAIIAALYVGTLSVSISVIFSHYFSGTGKPVYNMIASGIGCLITLIAGYFLIPVYGLTGAGFAVSLASSGSVIFQFIIFKINTKIRFREFGISHSDIQLIKIEMSKFLKKK